MMNKKYLTEIVGWYGMTAILLAYTLANFRFIAIGSFEYQILNLTGALGIVVISVAKKAKQPAVLNIIWAVVALIAIIGLMFPKAS
jgi:hypothetical protein